MGSGSVFLPKLDQEHAILVLAHMLKQLPFTPDFIQTDNGLEFQDEFHASPMICSFKACCWRMCATTCPKVACGIACFSLATDSIASKMFAQASRSRRGRSS